MPGPHGRAAADAASPREVVVLLVDVVVATTAVAAMVVVVVGRGRIHAPTRICRTAAAAGGVLGFARCWGLGELELELGLEIWNRGLLCLLVLLCPRPAKGQLYELMMAVAGPVGLVRCAAHNLL